MERWLGRLAFGVAIALGMQPLVAYAQTPAQVPVTAMGARAGSSGWQTLATHTGIAQPVGGQPLRWQSGGPSPSPSPATAFRAPLQNVVPAAATSSPSQAPAAPQRSAVQAAGAITSAGPAVRSSGGFDGVADCDFGCGEPPDPWVAVGPDHVVQAVNQEIAVYTRAGSTVGTASFASFFGAVSGQIGGIFDPHVVYAAASRRWIATAASFGCGGGYLYLAVSTGTNPTGSWIHYLLPFSDLPDYPDVGVTSDKIVITANQFSIVPSGGSCDGGTFVGSTFDVVDLARAMSGGPVTYTETLPSAWSFSWRTPVNLSASASMTLVAMGAARRVLYARVTGTNAASNVAIAALDLTGLGLLPAFTQPPVAHGATGFSADTIDGRPTDAVWKASRLWFVATSTCTPAGDVTARDCVRVAELDTSTATPTVRQDFTVSEAGKDDFMGGIGLAADGTLFIVYSTASGSHPIGISATLRFPVDPPNTYRAPALVLHAGATTYKGSRWGDYVGVAQDPHDPHGVWQADEYANGAGQWSTWVSHLTAIFTDISASTFVSDILWLRYAGITTGCSPTTFCPNDVVTRGQMAAFLDRALSLPSTSTDYFTDDATSIYQIDINRLAAAGITTGCSATTFCPNANVTRGQMAAFLVRALSLPAASTDYFSDDNGTTFEHDINALAAAGITTGCSATSFCPTNPVTRGQMAAFLHRALG